MRAVGVIPARFASVRFPGKVLAPILDKPLIQWVIEGSLQSRLLHEVIVATDDERVVKVANKCGVKAVMTSASLQSGSDRVYEAIKDSSFDIVLNIQGDEPLVKGECLDILVESFLKDPNLEMATLGSTRLTQEDLNSLNSVKVICNANQEALYFSRYPIPYSRRQFQEGFLVPVLKHLGFYGFKKSFLASYCSYGTSTLEEAESLEQLRALFMGVRIKVLSTNYETIGVDTPEDAIKIKNILLKREQL